MARLHQLMNWLVANREWLFSGVLVALPVAVIGWLWAKRKSQSSKKQLGGDSSVNVGKNLKIQGGAAMTDQAQKAGDNSTNIRTDSLTIHQGITLTEARQMALDVFRANFFELAGEAKDIARERAEEITGDFLKKLQEQQADSLKQSQEPDFQHALFTVQKEYARCGDKDLGNLLVDLLVDRAKQESRSILQIVLNESLVVAPKLTQDQLAALSLIFLFRYTVQQGIENRQGFWEYLDHYVAPFSDLISPKAACYQHLEYSGCGKAELVSVNLAEVFRKHYGGLFSKGFDTAQFETKQLSLPASHIIFTDCLNDRNRRQVSCINEASLRSVCERLEISEDDIGKLVALHNEALMSNEEIQEYIIQTRGYMRHVFEVWKVSNMNRFTLTSVGIAIGHANIKKSLGEFTNLSIWIN